MARFSFIASLSILATLAKAHFEVLHPEPLSEEEGDQNAGPCGGFDPSFSDSPVTDFHVGGEAIALKNGHAQVNWLFRATLDESAQSNWTQIFPIVQQAGIGDFCEPAITVTEEWVGKKGVLGLASNAPDGFLFQCAVVNFVEGVGEKPESCTNGTVQISFVDDTDLAQFVADSTDSAEETSTSEEPSSTDSPEDEDSGVAFLSTSLNWILSVASIGLLFVV